MKFHQSAFAICSTQAGIPVTSCPARFARITFAFLCLCLFAVHKGCEFFLFDCLENFVSSSIQWFLGTSYVTGHVTLRRLVHWCANIKNFPLQYTSIGMRLNIPPHIWEVFPSFCLAFVFSIVIFRFCVGNGKCRDVLALLLLSWCSCWSAVGLLVPLVMRFSEDPLIINPLNNSFT